MENNVILYGASGHCKVIIDILKNNSINIETIIDDNMTITSILGNVVLNSSQYNLSELNNLIIAIGNNKVRKKIAGQLNAKYAKAIHPKAIVSNFSSVDQGTVIMANAVVNPDVKIGKHCIINTGAVVEHDCIIDDYVHISPNAALAGGVVVAEGSHIGIGAAIIQNVKIGKWVTIGAGTVILKDIPDFAVVVGNPGKIIKYNKENE